MPKKKVESPKRELTKRQLTHHQKQNRIQRLTMWGGIGVIIVVVALIGTGLYLNNFKPFQAIVLKANDKQYSMDYYIDTLVYYTDANYQIYSAYGLDYETYLGYTVNSVASTIQQNQIIKEAAAKLEPPVTVSDDEVNKNIKDNKLTNNAAVKDAIYASLLESKLQDHFDKALPATAEQRAVLSMFLESQSQVDAIKDRIAKGETFQSIAEKSSLDTTTKDKSGDLGWVAQGVIPSTLNTPDDKILDNLVFSADTKTNVLLQAEDADKSKSLGYWVLQVLDTKMIDKSTQTPTPTPSATPTATPTPTTNVDQVQVNAMLLANAEQAKQMVNELKNGGDFATLAKANSQYTNAATDGGILGWISKGKLGGTADEALFPTDDSKILAKNTINDPIADTAQTTKGGFWLAQVTGIETKNLDGNNRTTLATVNKNDWRNKTWTDAADKISNLLTSEQTTFAQEQTLKRSKH